MVPRPTGRRQPPPRSSAPCSPPLAGHGEAAWGRDLRAPPWRRVGADRSRQARDRSDRADRRRGARSGAGYRGPRRALERPPACDVSETLAYRLLTPHIATFRREHPWVIVELALDNRVLNLSHREAGVALRPMRPGAARPAKCRRLVSGWPAFISASLLPPTDQFPNRSCRPKTGIAISTCGKPSRCISLQVANRRKSRLVAGTARRSAAPSARAPAHFTAPSVSPRTRKRCSVAKTMATGNVATSVAAITWFHSTE